MNIRNKLATTTAMALGLAFLAVPVMAQETPTSGVTHLGQVILGYRADGTPVYAGQNSSEIDTQDLRLTGGANAVEGVLRQQTSVFTQQDIGNPAIAVNIRGFEGSGRVAMSVDGVPQNFRFTGHAAQSGAYVDSNLLSDIDITRGAVTTVGGSGIAGSVNFRTLSVEDVVRSGSGWGGLSRLSYGDNGNAKSGMIAAGYTDGAFSSVLALSRSTADDYKDGNGDKIAGSHEDIGSGLLKLGYNFGDGQSLSFSAMRYDADFFAASYDQELQSNVYTLGYKYNAGDGLINLDVNLYSNETETEWVCCNAPPFAMSAGRIMSTKTTGLNVTNVSEANFGNWGLTSVNGFDYSKDKLGGLSGGVNPTTGDSSRGSIFSENIFTNGPWEITAGLRASKYELSDNAGEIDVSHDSVDPKLSIAYQASDWLQPYVTISKATRAPTLQEVILGGSAHGRGMIANPDLKPEESKGYELGINIAKQGVFTGDDQLSGRLNYYKMDVENYVTSVMGFTNRFGSTGAAFVNLPGTSKTEGFEVELKYTWANIDVGAAYTRNNTSMPSQMPGLGAGQYLPDSTLSLSLAGRFLEDRLTLGANYDYVSGGLYTARYTTDPVQRDTSYELVDLFAVYDVTENFAINARVKNVFDKDYTPWLSSDEPGPGRSAYLGGEFRF